MYLLLVKEDSFVAEESFSFSLKSDFFELLLIVIVIFVVDAILHQSAAKERVLLRR
jgi:hypothetical protein